MLVKSTPCTGITIVVSLLVHHNHKGVNVVVKVMGISEAKLITTCSVIQ